MTTPTNAWQVTEEDIAQVLASHAYVDDANDILNEVIMPEVDRVIAAALHYTDFNDQVDSALDEIETILIEADVLMAPKLYQARCV